MKTNIALIGFMGTGKSASGQSPGGKLNKNMLKWILDRQKAGKSIPEIFWEEGEITFRGNGDRGHQRDRLQNQPGNRLRGRGGPQ